MLLFMTTMPVCDVTKTQFYPKILAVSNLPPANTCPMPKVATLIWPQILQKFIILLILFQGNYTINNLVIDESFFPSVLPTGDSYILTKIFVEGKPVYGVKLTMNIKNAK